MMLMEVSALQKKSLVLILVKQIQSLHCNHDNSYLFVHGKLICKVNAGNKNVNFPTQFCLGSLSNKFRAIDSREVSFKENVYDFSVDNNDIDKSNILSIRKYLLTKNNVK